MTDLPKSCFRMHVEAIADLLQTNGKQGPAGQMENPFGVSSDWEHHVLVRVELPCTERCYAKSVQKES
uniref:Uncharacterized protein n=1 Tax=Leersia perrieri TaxID=77586 RepID=A0A0D9XK34_9ORYZ